MKTRPSSPGSSWFSRKETDLKAKRVHHACRWTPSCSWETWSRAGVAVTVKETPFGLSYPERSRNQQEEPQSQFALVLSRRQTGSFHHGDRTV